MGVESILKMDIFFAVTTAFVVACGVFLCVILFYVVKIVKSVSKILTLVQQEAQEISEDFKEIKKEVKAGVSDMREGIATATNYTKVVAGAGIVRALSGLFEAVAVEKEEGKKRRQQRKKAE